MSNIEQLPWPDFTPRGAIVAASCGMGDDTVNRKPSVEQTAASTPEARIAQLFTEIGAAVNISRNGELYAEDQPVDNVYRVESGVIRTCKILNDGRRQIDGFYVAGDVVGLEMRSRHAYYAEAISQVSVRAVRLRALRARAETSGSVSSALWDMTARELHRSQEHILLLGRRSAQERVACFLLSMAERLPRRPSRAPVATQDAGNADPMVSESPVTDLPTVDLPMSRQDMADYLGLTIETVSRTFTQLEAMGAIALTSARKVRLSNPAALRDMHG